MSGASESAGRLVPGLCSVTFRDLSVGEVAAHAAAAGVAAIEWGGDVHVPPGDAAAARAAAAATAAVGLAVCSYGSYVFADGNGPAALPAALDAADALGTRLVRVWGPLGVEPDPAAPQWSDAARTLAAMAGAAAERDSWLYLELHSGTPTATARSAAALVAAVDSEHLLCAWQPPYWAPQPAEADVADLALLAPHLGPLHVYAWDPDGTRHPLAHERDRWTVRLAAAIATPPVGPGPRHALVEFVAGDDPSRLAADAAVLRDLIHEAGAGRR